MSSYRDLRPGRIMRAEIAEQPAALERLLEQAPTISEIARSMASHGARNVRIVGHGSSDNASAYGIYAFGLLPGWTALRDSISLSVYYDAKLDFRESVVLALSQSGRTTDVIAYVERARRNGAFTVALTNDVESPLADACEAVLPLAAGDERSVAATKTYVNQVAALALLAAFAADVGASYVAGIHETAELLHAWLPGIEAAAGSVAEALTAVERMFVVGRGPEYATAREISLKLLETCRLAAEPLTATALAHGPVAALDALFPVWAVAGDGPSLPAVVEAASRARDAGSIVVASGPGASRIAGAELVLPVPEPPMPLLGPLLSVVPGQLVAWSLSCAKSLDPDQPVGLSKVTRAA
jgi:glucosamine--fructose-6-phosphate aminotransferase (isomerizing)